MIRTYQFPVCSMLSSQSPLAEEKPQGGVGLRTPDSALPDLVYVEEIGTVQRATTCIRPDVNNRRFLNNCVACGKGLGVGGRETSQGFFYDGPSRCAECKAKRMRELAGAR